MLLVRYDLLPSKILSVQRNFAFGDRQKRKFEQNINFLYKKVNIGEVQVLRYFQFYEGHVRDPQFQVENLDAGFREELNEDEIIGDNTLADLVWNEEEVFFAFLIDF